MRIRGKILCHIGVACFADFASYILIRRSLRVFRGLGLGGLWLVVAGSTNIPQSPDPGQQHNQRRT